MFFLFNVLLFFHVLSGFIGLIIGSTVLLRKKGDAIHKKTGTIFFYSMLTAGASSLTLAIIHPNYFLFIVGVFTLYMLFTGTRYLRFKKNNVKPNKTDWLITLLMLLTAIIFIVLGVIQLLHQNDFGIVFIVFGLLSMRLLYSDYLNYIGKFKEKNYWLMAHIQRLVGTYIASFTAFLVVNSNYLPNFIPSWLVWIFPTIILTPLILKWSKKYKVVI